MIATMIFMPVMPVPLHCINEAAMKYHVSAKLIMSVLVTERGKVGQIVRNKNGTYDIGPAQINSSWLPELKKYNITQSDIQYNACINVTVAAWILSKKIAQGDGFLEGVGDYNSHTYSFNKSYIEKVRVNFTKISMLLG